MWKELNNQAQCIAKKKVPLTVAEKTCANRGKIGIMRQKEKYEGADYKLVPTLNNWLLQRHIKTLLSKTTGSIANWCQL